MHFSKNNTSNLINWNYVINSKSYQLHCTLVYLYKQQTRFLFPINSLYLVWHNYHQLGSRCFHPNIGCVHHYSAYSVWWGLMFSGVRVSRHSLLTCLRPSSFHECSNWNSSYLAPCRHHCNCLKAIKRKLRAVQGLIIDTAKCYHGPHSLQPVTTEFSIYIIIYHPLPLKLFTGYHEFWIARIHVAYPDNIENALR